MDSELAQIKGYTLQFTCSRSSSFNPNCIKIYLSDVCQNPPEVLKTIYLTQNNLLISNL